MTFCTCRVSPSLSSSLPNLRMTLCACYVSPSLSSSLPDQTMALCACCMSLSLFRTFLSAYMGHDIVSFPLCLALPSFLPSPSHSYSLSLSVIFLGVNVEVNQVTLLLLLHVMKQVASLSVEYNLITKIWFDTSLWWAIIWVRCSNMRVDQGASGSWCECIKVREDQEFFLKVQDKWNDHFFTLTPYSPW